VAGDGDWGAMRNSEAPAMFDIGPLDVQLTILTFNTQ